MTSIVSVSAAELKNRRQQLRRQRRVKFWQAIWRSLLISGMAGGLFWLITLPNWVIRQSSQIDIEGNQFLSPEAIRSLIPLDYPQSILQIEPQKLSQQLEAIAPVVKVTVTRQFLPPSLTIQVQERKPVAIATSPYTKNQAKKSQSEELGFLDEEGIWTPKSSYVKVKADLPLPKLKITGFSSEQLSHWSTIYHSIQSSTVPISELNWRDPNNLILQTELGKIYCGANISQLPRQLEALAKMRQLSDKIKTSDIKYIDLTNPESPSVSLNPDIVVQDATKAQPGKILTHSLPD